MFSEVWKYLLLEQPYQLETLHINDGYKLVARVDLGCFVTFWWGDEIRIYKSLEDSQLKNIGKCVLLTDLFSLFTTIRLFYRV